MLEENATQIEEQYQGPCLIISVPYILQPGVYFDALSPVHESSPLRDNESSPLRDHESSPLRDNESSPLRDKDSNSSLLANLLAQEAVFVESRNLIASTNAVGSDHDIRYGFSSRHLTDEVLKRSSSRHDWLVSVR